MKNIYLFPVVQASGYLLLFLNLLCKLDQNSDVCFSVKVFEFLRFDFSSESLRPPIL